jgi:16S rRNA (cytosine967-C5)-methyltransferase
LASDGVLEIQDEGSQFMAHFALWPDEFADRLDEMPGAEAMDADSAVSTRVLKAGAPIVVDACAGAGGKSLALADLMDGRGRVFAYDVSSKKLMALKKRARKSRMNSIQAVELEEGREAEMLSRFKGTADIVLVDAPCSGFGILRRSPDIKWKSGPADLGHLPEVQLRLLNLYSALVRPGGRLVYGLCTFSREESLGVVSRFQAGQGDFIPTRGGFLGPFSGSSDGFFMQAFRRVGG